MRDFKNVIFELKMYIADGKKIKVLDKELADALCIAPSKFATIKKRNAMPYEAVLHYCKKEDICPIELFFE